jgi:peroxiredoxin
LPQFARETREQNRLPFEVLSDPHNDVAERFGLRYRLPEYLIELYRSFPLDLPTFNGDDSWTLPIPARFVVSGDGRIRKVDADPDYTRRPEPEETVAFLKALASSSGRNEGN